MTHTKEYNNISTLEFENEKIDKMPEKGIQKNDFNITQNPEKQK